MRTVRLIRASIALVALSTLSPQLSTCFAQGSLTPPGAPAPTMKSLDQVEARTAITNAGAVTISQAGSYYLTRNITVASGDAITITANNVTLDLNGFTIASTQPTANTNSAILLSGGRTNIAIYNGHISSRVTNNLAGVYSGSGFSYGIYYSVDPPFNVRVKGVDVVGVLAGGIYLAAGKPTAVESCTVTTAGSYGIYADRVSDSTALDCGNYGIICDAAHNCKGNAIGSGTGLFASVAHNCSGSSSGNGIGLFATTVNNSIGFSSTGTGLSATTVATGCYGISQGNGTGLSAIVANNCQGESVTGTGLIASEGATNCRGISFGGGIGVSAGNASNCRGNSSSGTGLNATYTASYCSGVSTSGTGLIATIAIGCTASSVSATYKYLMPGGLP